MLQNNDRPQIIRTMQDTITREEYKPEQPFIPTDKRGVNKSSHVGGNGENVGSENETPLEDGKIVPLELPEEQQNSETPVPFPIHCLPVGVGDFVKEVARDAMIPESMVALTALGILGASLGAGIKLRTYRGTLCGNLFILMAVSSGIGKDLALGKVKAPLSELDSERSKHWFSEELPKLKSESKLIRREIAAIEKGKTEAVGKLPELEKELAELERLEKKEPFLMISDATREALVMALATQPGETVALVTSEGRGALSNITGRYARGISDADIYCGGYSGTPVTVIRVGRESVRLDAPCLTSLLMTQPDNFAKVMADPEMVESGYLPRNLIHDPKAERQDIPDFHESASPRILQRWSGLIQILVKSYRDRPRGNEVCAVVEPSPEALCAVKDYYNEIAKRSRKDGDLVDIGIYTARWAENACKIDRKSVV